MSERKPPAYDIDASSSNSYAPTQTGFQKRSRTPSIASHEVPMSVATKYMQANDHGEPPARTVQAEANNGMQVVWNQSAPPKVSKGSTRSDLIFKINYVVVVILDITELVMAAYELYRIKIYTDIDDFYFPHSRGVATKLCLAVAAFSFITVPYGYVRWFRLRRVTSKLSHCHFDVLLCNGFMWGLWIAGAALQTVLVLSLTENAQYDPELIGNAERQTAITAIAWVLVAAWTPLLAGAGYRDWREYRPQGLQHRGLV